MSKAWAPLFEGSRRKGVTPIQFALAGMNAHINNDLPWALMQTWDELGDADRPDSPEYRDFELVNRILEEVAVGVRATLESGLLRWLDRVLGRLDDIVASVVISKARDDAWKRAARWRRSFDTEAAEAHECHVGYESHLILRRVRSHPVATRVASCAFRRIRSRTRPRVGPIEPIGIRSACPISA